MPKPRVALGFDFGLKHIGVAVGQTITQEAKPITTVKAKNGEPEWGAIDKLVKTWQPNVLVVGLPLNMDGTPQPISEHAHTFAKQLQIRYGLEVHLVDERLTTVEAKAQLFAEKGYRALSKAHIDSTSAALILNDWLAQQGQQDE